MKKRLIATAGAAVALAVLVPSAAYASTSTASQQTLAVQAGTLFVSSTTPANITAQVDGTGSGALPSAEWGDLTGSGDGWQGSIAASNFIYTGNWSPVGSAPALSSDTSAGYTGTADGDTYTVTITSVSGATINFTYSSTNGASGTGTATAGTAADVGSNGLTITFSTSATYAAGDAYQIDVGTQNQGAMTLDDASNSATITPYGGAASTPPAYVNTVATITGDGNTYGSAVPFLSAAQGTGMGEYTVSPQATVTTDLNSWAATYTGNVQYTISSGPYVNPLTASSASIPIVQAATGAILSDWSVSLGDGAPYPAGANSSPLADGGWVNIQNGYATYKFTVAPGQSSELAYETPKGGYMNEESSTVSVNGGTPIETNAQDISSDGGSAPSTEVLWMQNFTAGSYTVTIASSGSINVYGLWASNLSAITSG
jgi:hypothetical protein